jgi:FMN phosphatase YigB (HAD superfamily)
MVKAVLLDLDDTLILSQTNSFFLAYLRALGQYGSSIAAPEQFIGLLMASFVQALEMYDPASTLYERFMKRFSASVGKPEEELASLFDRFYTERYPDLCTTIRPQPLAADLLHWLFEHDYQVVVATNPGLPFVATRQRMQWGQIPPEEYPFALITTLDTMHFGKPRPEYYEEILLRMDVEANEAIMVGDDWENDMVGAAAVGLHTFWLTSNSTTLPDPSLPLDGQGSFEEFVRLAQGGWLDTLDGKPTLDRQKLIRRLAVFPAAIDDLCRRYPRAILECCPGEHEWSVRDIICHLCDHESTEDRVLLRRIIEEENPFLSASYDPWSHAHQYATIPLEQALREFVSHRTETVKWLGELPEQVWKRPARSSIFGPTCFEEMVRFVTEHDRTHLRQMRHAIAYALESCDSQDVAL